MRLSRNATQGQQTRSPDGNDSKRNRKEMGTSTTSPWQCVLLKDLDAKALKQHLDADANTVDVAVDADADVHAQYSCRRCLESRHDTATGSCDAQSP
jgi:hypothetical protein